MVDLGQPTFSYDGEVWFLVLVEEVATTWWPSLLGTAHARGLHNQPGDWWSVAVEGGEPTQRTFMEITPYDGVLDEEGRLATATELGLAVVEPDQSVAWVWVARTLRATDWAVTQGE